MKNKKFIILEKIVDDFIYSASKDISKETNYKQNTWLKYKDELSKYVNKSAEYYAYSHFFPKKYGFMIDSDEYYQLINDLDICELYQMYYNKVNLENKYNTKTEVACEALKEYLINIFWSLLTYKPKLVKNIRLDRN